MIYQNPTPDASKNNLGVEVDGTIFTFHSDSITGVLPIEKWSPVPTAPAYVLGTVHHEGEIYTIVRPELSTTFGKTPSRSSRKRSTPQVGLVVKHPNFHPFILAGERAHSAELKQDIRWVTATIPAPLALK
ncbi:MAG: chemotaxis protein CheW [Opitutaceae bacterium]